MCVRGRCKAWAASCVRLSLTLVWPMTAGAQKDEGEDGLGMQPGTGYSPHPSTPTLADMGDSGQPLVPGSQSSSVEPQFRSTSLNALAGTWTIPFSELVRSCC